MRVQETKTTGGTPELLAVDAKRLAKLLNVSVRHIRRMDSSGQLPRAVKIGRAIRWLLDEIRDWLRAGSPDRVTWERLRKSKEVHRAEG